ncbi:MAG TPA: helical backbone metal receptor [Burkholderiaceae bacterium]|nr:helical backbone metal receptor [Burkholderiaceae bacterium]
MFKQFLLQLLMVIGLTGFCLTNAQAAEVRVTDDRGLVRTFAKTPQRIVSLLPSLSETVCALGECARLVGVDRYSNWPATLKKLPQLGGGLDPNIEAIVMLKPDVVLAAGSSKAIAQLESLGIPVIALEPKSHSDMKRVLYVVNDLLAMPVDAGANRVWREIDKAMAGAAKAMPAKATGLPVYFEVNDAPYAAGRTSFIGETLARLGLQNIIPASLGVFPKINPEFVVQANPALIMIGRQEIKGMKERPGWTMMRAVRENRICVFSSDENDVLVRAGPRMAQAAEIILKCIKDKAP